MTIEGEATSATLLAAIRRDSGLDDLAYAVEPTPVGGGFWAEILTFRLDGRDTLRSRATSSPR